MALTDGQDHATSGQSPAEKKDSASAEEIHNFDNIINPQTDSLLFSLPLELREMIYGYCSYQNRLPSARKEPDHETDALQFLSDWTSQGAAIFENVGNLAATCKLVKLEALSVCFDKFKSVTIEMNRERGCFRDDLVARRTLYGKLQRVFPSTECIEEAQIGVHTLYYTYHLAVGWRGDGKLELKATTIGYGERNLCKPILEYINRMLGGVSEYPSIANRKALAVQEVFNIAEAFYHFWAKTKSRELEGLVENDVAYGGPNLLGT